VIVAAIAVPAGTSAYADTVDGLVEFTAGSTARADEVNGNFSEVADSVDDNDARIAALEAALEAQTDEIAGLRAQLSNVLNVNEYLSLETVNDQPTVRLTGANLQIVNGMGETATSNGTGNVLIGYDERRDEADYEPRCSLGNNPHDGHSAVTNEEECIAAGGLVATNHTGGSHYLIVGPEHNYSRWGGIVAGLGNSSSYDFASVSGGSENTASGRYASISGGTENRTTALGSSISGGSRNLAIGRGSSVSGGVRNVANGAVSSVSGGDSSSAIGLAASVSGGYENSASGFWSSVSGGANRNASGGYGWVAGSPSEEE
jgi:hypothetical protein